MNFALACYLSIRGACARIFGQEESTTTESITSPTDGLTEQPTLTRPCFRSCLSLQFHTIPVNMKIAVLLAVVAMVTLCNAVGVPNAFNPSTGEMISRQNSQEGALEQSPEDNSTEDMDEDSEERAFLEEVREEFIEEMESMVRESIDTEISEVETSQDTSAPRPPLKRVRTQKTKCSLEGAWRNDHGSEMVLNMTGEGHITGEYRTAVESKLGAAGTGPSLIRGAGSRSGASTFGFSVVWRGGASTTTWAGQCLICDGQEILETTWLLVGEVAGCEDSWMSTRVGKDTFYRIPKQEVRKYKGHLVPRD
ncbi:uncharacterized protein LOC118418006 isoform X2 [Branchiostoma floridae]|uniref:Uncharacterized protein LOC118418006 isoform X2 n=1 Tax=Branchiostoma floridae TaxID=7739 RepID=A0A9J7LBN2_BRAFL|nr:uncharacterized protein LOC118418006 isoform X2 [Branchiostoma floridae]